MFRSERPNNFIVAIQAAMKRKQSEMWTALPAAVEKYTSSDGKQIVSAQPSIKAQVLSPEGKWTWVQLPMCVDCPVHFPSGGGFTLTFPIKKGDEGLLVFSSRCIDAWWQSGGVQNQSDLRMHDLSDGMFIPGFRSQKNKLTPAPSGDNVQLRSDDGKRLVEITADKVRMQNDTKAVVEVGTNYVKGSYNSESRFVASDTVAKIRRKDSWVVVDGTDVIVSSAPIVGPDPDSN